MLPLLNLLTLLSCSDDARTPDTDTDPTPDTASTCDTERRHVAYSWHEVTPALNAPDLLNTEQYGLYELAPDAQGNFNAEPWGRLETNLREAEPGQRAMILRAYNSDQAPHAHPDDPPYYWDNGVAEAAALVGAVAAELKQRDLELDRLFLDYEWHLSRGYLETLSEKERQAITADPRYQTELQPLFDQQFDTHTQEPLLFTASPEEVLADPWTLLSYQWNRTMIRHVRAAFREGLVDPMLAAFPDLQVSNYDDWRPGDQLLVPDSNGHAMQRIGFSDEDPLAGNQASIQIYGRMNQIESGWRNNPDATSYPTSYPVGPGNALRWAVRKAASAAASGDKVDVWVAPKAWQGHPYYTPLSCDFSEEAGDATCTDHWEESILHAVLQTDGPLIYWSDFTPELEHAARFQAVLDTLNELLSCADRTPLGSLDQGWEADVLVSGMELADQRWWRVSSASDEAPNPDQIVEDESGVTISWSETPLVVPEGTLWPEHLSTQGRWLVQPLAAPLPYWDETSTP